MKGTLVYACCGCSGAAQMANHLALRLDCSGFADMACTAGVGGGVSELVQIAQSGRRLLAIDGCDMHCAASCLARAGLIADIHLVLAEHGVKKRPNMNFDPAEAQRVYATVVLPAARSLYARAKKKRNAGTSG